MFTKPTRRLPTEILLLIRNWIDPSDLRTHVCYYLSSRMVAGLYNSEEDADEFWELACWYCGLGLTPSDEDAGRSWKDIAIECIKADGFCTLSGCGESLLCHNRQEMEQAIYHHDLAPLDVYLDADHGVVFQIHSALEKLRFIGGRGAPLLQDATFSDTACGRLPFFEGNRWALGAHPLLYRSFATFAPSTKMMLRPVAGRLLEGHRLSRTNALTIYDVVNTIHADLDRPLTVQNLVEYVRTHQSCLPKDLAQSYLGPLQRLQSLRDLLRICPTKEYAHVADDDEHGPIFVTFLACTAENEPHDDTTMQCCEPETVSSQL
ncbi:hypothetical protein L226DRAFT_561398 [Lentinus tigrinus ALCF2SS1-7]|uniref:Uncharacterized protein n=1 Tax=Lentinus tigrinus ALCF2SS1-6 TaxID=1328759 RepID=A0A5C2S5N4_9APHY|nr:hypothetical protein L227DRAFT_654341 [Lentinus tigrinus ALCF2SS1-6]RPD73377.1 hypothetical protein L226DRAFT_561398 [Lentinus tigrinus ALCF2SS1-7]